MKHSILPTQVLGSPPRFGVQESDFRCAACTGRAWGSASAGRVPDDTGVISSYFVEIAGAETGPECDQTLTVDRPRRQPGNDLARRDESEDQRRYRDQTAQRHDLAPTDADVGDEERAATGSVRVARSVRTSARMNSSIAAASSNSCDTGLRAWQDVQLRVNCVYGRL